jgi:hypothetical protein
MHRALLAVTLTLPLLAPALWDLISGRPGEPAPAVQQKEGPGLDPSGLAASSPRSEEGPGLDPDGRS